jgi:hypothetical protein
MADFDLGGLLFGNAPSTGLEAYLDPEQLRRMQQQGAMQAAMALLKASGPSRTPVGFGQALGEAYGAGQAGYQQAQQQGIASLMTKQKMEDAERARKMQENYTKMVLGLTGGEAPSAGAMTPESALAAPVTAELPGGPTTARAEMIGQPTSSLGSPAAGGTQMQRGNLSPQMALLLSQLPASAGIPELMKYMQPPKTVGEPFRAADGQTYIRTESGGVMPFSIGLAPKTVGEPFKGADGQTYIRTDSGGVMPFSVGIAPKTVGEPFKGADGQTYIRTESGGVMPFATGLAIKPVGAPHPVINAAGKAVLMQSYDDGTQKEISGLSPYEAVSPDIRAVEYLGGKPLAGTGQAGIGLVGEYRKQIAPKTTVNVPVDMTGGQKGFENEMALGKAFKNEPIYKDFNEMQSAYSQVVSSLKQGTPIGDVAGATKVMKLLDPNSVVRESELGIAMAAAGRMDRLQNYFSNMMSGQKLTPTQRDDFQNLSNELYAAAGQAYNKKRQEYEQFGTSYGFKNLGTALGAQAQVPSLMRGGPGSAERKPLGSIFQR